MHIRHPLQDKVISLVCERIQSLIKPSFDRVLIVDFKGAPKLYTSPTTCPVDVPGIAELGESDVKYARYVHILGNSIVCATDGDYIPIAMLYYATHGITPNNNIYLFRQLANIDPPNPPASRSRPTAKAAALAPAKPRARRARIMVRTPAYRICAHTPPKYARK
jgi:hypothetical protein